MNVPLHGTMRLTAEAIAAAADGGVEITATPRPDFFSGVTIETDGIADRARSIHMKSTNLADAVQTATQERSVAALKAAIALNDTLGAEIQADLSRMRSLIGHLDRKLAAFQARRPRA